MFASIDRASVAIIARGRVKRRLHTSACARFAGVGGARLFVVAILGLASRTLTAAAGTTRLAQVGQAARSAVVADGKLTTTCSTYKIVAVFGDSTFSGRLAGLTVNRGAVSYRRRVGWRRGIKLRRCVAEFGPIVRRVRVGCHGRVGRSLRSGRVRLSNNSWVAARSHGRQKPRPKAHAKSFCRIRQQLSAIVAKSPTQSSARRCPLCGRLVANTVCHNRLLARQCRHSWLPRPASRAAVAPPLLRPQSARLAHLDPFVAMQPM